MADNVKKFEKYFAILRNIYLPSLSPHGKVRHPFKIPGQTL